MIRYKNLPIGLLVVWLVGIALGSLVSGSVFAKEVYQDTSGSFFIESAGGKQAYQAELAFGLEPENMPDSFGGLYIGTSSLTSEGHVHELGIKAFNFSEFSKTSYGAVMHVALSQTRLNNYERRGLEIGATLYGVIHGPLMWLGGVTIRPRFLSLEWRHGAKTEMRSKVGINYRLPYDISVFAFYQYDNFLTSSWHSQKLNGTAFMGVNILF